MMKLSAMPKYEAYKDSGVEWLGEIPAHWAVIRFRDSFKFGRGLTITKENLQDEGIPCVSYGEIHSKYGFEVTPKKHYLKCVSEDYLIKGASSLLNKGDFIFADTSEDIEGSGNFSQLITDDVVFAGYHVVICRPIVKGERRYLAYCLDSISYRNQIKNQIKGVKVYSITQSILKNTKIWLPKIEEQSLIAKFLDQKTAQIDEAIAIKEQQIELLKERKQIIIQQAVTRGLEPNVPMKESGVEWIGQIPEHWELKKIKHVAGEFMYGTSVDCNTLESGVPVLRIPNVNELKFDFDDLKFASLSKSEEQRYLLHKDDILIIRTNGNPKVVGKSALFKGQGKYMFASYLIRIRPQKNVVSEFLIRALNSFSVRKAFTYGARTSVGNYNLNTQTIGDCYLAFPPLNEQVNILNCLLENEASFEIAIKNEIKQIENLKEYKATLINSAVTGKIKITPDMIQADAVV